jgi:hypothetical protein
MKLALTVLGTLLLTACAGNSDIEGERVTVGPNGVENVCGEGNGLPECTDYNNLTYSENLEEKAPTDKEMEKEAAKVRAETPQELDKTITELEQDPEALDTLAE